MNTKEAYEIVNKEQYMKIIINIPKDKYLFAKRLAEGGKEDNPVVLAIGNGIPLSE